MTYLDDIDPPDTGLLTNLIELDEEFKAVRIHLIPNSKLDWQALLEANGDVNGLIRRGTRIIGSGPHVIWRRYGRVLQITRLVAAVSYVIVHALAIVSTLAH